MKKWLTISKEFQNEKKHRPIEQWEFNEYHGFEPESDENFAYIAGYTPGVAPYGVTWDERKSNLLSNDGAQLF